jgi:hypothetical protein
MADGADERERGCGVSDLFVPIEPTVHLRFPRDTAVPRRDMEDIAEACDTIREATSLVEAQEAAHRIEKILRYHETDGWYGAMRSQSRGER